LDDMTEPFTVSTQRGPDARVTDRRLFYWSLTSALAGFLFGFDTVVISGAEQTIQRLWKLSAGMHGIAMGAALYGTVLGSIVGSWPPIASAASPPCSRSACCFSRRRSPAPSRERRHTHRRAIRRRARHRHQHGRGAVYISKSPPGDADGSPRCSSSTSCSAS
jgi:hypothetical protein